jgi:hypothetical protein
MAYRQYCVIAAQAVDQGLLGQEDAAYDICGMSAELVNPIPSDVDAVIALACDLELPSAQRANRDTDWHALAKLISPWQTKDPMSL